MLFQNWLQALRSANIVRGYWQARGRRVLRSSTGSGPTLIHSAALAATPAAVETLECRALLTAIAVPSVTAGNIAVGGEVDSYSFTAVAGESYQFETVLGSNPDTILTLFAANGTTVLATNDDISTSNRGSRINWVAPSSGQNFLSVRSFNTTQTGSYILNATRGVSIAVPSSTAGNIAAMGEADTFRFNAVAGETFEFATVLGSNSDTTLTVYGPDGTTELAFDDDSGPGRASLVLFTAATTGEHFVTVRSFGGLNTGTYTLNAFRRSQVAVPSSTAGNISVGGEVDTFRFAAVAGQLYNFNTVLGTLGDSRLTLLDIDGTTVLASNDDAGNNLRSNLDWTAPEDGLYLLAVQSPSLAGTGSYSLNVAAVTAITAPSGTAGEISTTGETDFYRFTAVAGRSYVVSTAANFRLRAYSHSLAVNETSDSMGGGTSNSRMVFTATSNENVYVSVAAKAGVTTPAAYGLQISEAVAFYDTAGTDEFEIRFSTATTRDVYRNGVFQGSVIGSAGIALRTGTGANADPNVGPVVASTDTVVLTGLETADNLIVSGEADNFGVFRLDGPNTFINNVYGFVDRVILQGRGGDDTLRSEWTRGVTLDGGTGNDQLNGGPSADILSGGDNNDLLRGNGGDDILGGGNGDDWYQFDTDAQLGLDSILDPSGLQTLDFVPSALGVNVNLAVTTEQVVNANLRLNLFHANRILRVLGGSGSDTINGNSLSNVLSGGAGNDTITGGFGSDVYLFDTDSQLGLDTLSDIDGVDTLDFSSSALAVTVDLDRTSQQTVNANLQLILGSRTAFENATGGAGADALYGNDGPNTLIGGPGDDTLAGWIGNDVYLFDTDSPLGRDALYETGGVDTLDFSPSVLGVSVNLGQMAVQTVNANLQLTLSSGSAFENLTGGSGNDQLFGQSSINALTGGAGNDTLDGGDGNDRYFFDTDFSLGIDTLNDSSGIDTLDFSQSALGVAANLSLTTQQPVNANLQLVLTSATMFENAVGGSGNDSFIGNDLTNSFTGNGGSDSLAGAAGNDWYFFDADIPLGTDTLVDSSGIDTLDFTQTAAGVIVNLATNFTQNVNPNLSILLGSTTGFENVNGGSGNDTLTGNDLNNTLTGNAGSDTLTGGNGNDRFVFDTDFALGADTLFDSAGIETLDFSPSALAVNVNLGLGAQQTVNSNLQLLLGSVTAFEIVTGGTGDDQLTGSAIDNTLIGGAGNDTLAGGDGNDTFLFNPNSQLGIDTLFDASGIDTLDFSPSMLAVVVNLAQPTQQSVNSNLQLNLGSEAVFENVIGGAGSDTLIGNSLNNTLRGNGGNDLLSGGAANDTYLFDTDTPLAADTLDDVSGQDTLDFSASVLGVNVNLGLAAMQTVNANLQLNLGSAAAFENVIGGEGNDTLTGNALANRLSGRGANDRLTGGEGADLLEGDSGEDTFLFDTDSPLGVDTLNDSAGVDTLDFSASALGVIVDLGQPAQQMVNANLQLILGSATLFENVTGGSGNDQLTGNSVNNSFQGGLGNDTFVFDADTPLGSDTVRDVGGIDTLSFAPTSLAVISDLSSAGQTVNSNLFLNTVSPSSPLELENLIGGSGNDNLIGNSLNNSITGGEGNDLLYGLEGNDSLSGGGGNDRYQFNTTTPLGTDTVLETGGVDSLEFALSQNAVTVDLSLTTPQIVNNNLTLLLGNTVPQLEGLVGGGGDDTLIGNNQNNTLQGNRGNDLLVGGAGSDTYLFDADSVQGTDTVVDSAGSGDTLDFSLSNFEGVNVNLGQSAAQVVASQLTLILDSLTPAIENVIGGDQSDTIIGNSLNNRFQGRGGNDRYVFDTDTQLGIDTIDDSAGIDTLDFSPSALAVAVNLAQTAQQTVNSNLRLVLTSGIAIENLTGGAGNDTLLGNDRDNVITGNAGNDLMNGGRYSDTYVFAAATSTETDTVHESNDALGGFYDRLDFSAMTTAISVNLSSLGTSLATMANRTVLTTAGGAALFEQVLGGSGDDVLLGNAAPNFLQGNGGNDSLTGFAGDDTLQGDSGNDRYVFDTDTQLGNDTLNDSAGVDTLDFSDSTLDLLVDAGALGEVGIVVNDNLKYYRANNSQFETVIGGSGDDLILGTAADNRLEGRGGRDFLLGGNGADTLLGGTGGDLLWGGRVVLLGDVLEGLFELYYRWLAIDTYANRVNAVRTGSPAMNSSSLLDDAGAADQIDPGVGIADSELDLVFLHVNDSSINFETGEQVIQL